MQRVIELGRGIRERHGRGVKTPLKELIVVHPDADFLADITGEEGGRGNEGARRSTPGPPTLCPCPSPPRCAGELRDYVAEELNVWGVTPCADPLQYATLRAEPNVAVLGKRLGKAVAGVSKAVRALPTEVRAREVELE